MAQAGVGKSNHPDSDSDDDGLFEYDEHEDEKVSIRVITWNLEGAEDPPHPKDLNLVAYPTENKHVHVFALQEVKCLDRLREGLMACIGGSDKFELFEHWMGRTGTGFAGQTVLLVFVPKELCRTGKFRLSRYTNHQVKREVLRGTRFKLLGGTTASRGAVSMPFTFLDTTFALVSVRLLEEETEKAIDQQQKDLEKILELCSMSENSEMGVAGSIHHAFLCGSFAMGQPKSSQQQQNENNTTTRKSIKSRFSFMRKANTSTKDSMSSSSTSLSSFQYDGFTQVRQRFPMIDSYNELDSSTMAFEPDHIFYRCAAPKLESCLEPVSSSLLTSVRCGRPPVSVLFKVRGRSPNLLTSWARLTGNLHIHLSSRSNYVHAKKEVAQRPRISTATMLRKEKEERETRSRSTLGDIGIPTHKMSVVEEVNEKFVLECTRCEAPINDSEVTVPVTKDGNPYHLRCFCCDHCGVPLCNEATTDGMGDVSFHEVDGKLYCQKSFETLYVKCCEGCGGALGDEFLMLPGSGGEERRFHISCFKCAVCSRPFATKVLMGDIVVEAAIPHDGRYLCEHDFAQVVGGVKCCICDHSFEKGIKISGDIYCQQDFEEIFGGGNCTVCQKAVTTESEALALSSSDPSKKRACHVACLKCCTCEQKIADLNQSFVEFESKIYCQEDWDKRQATQTVVLPNCGKCLQPVREDRLEAIGKIYHPKCFTCSFCDMSLAGIRFYVSDGSPWCLNDYERFCSPDLPACASCHRTVGSADVSKAHNVEGRTWHNECFVCSRCGVSMVNKQHRILKNKIFCSDC